MEKDMFIERVFENNSPLKIEDIVNSLIKERIDNKVKEYYSTLNHTTSFEKEM